MSLTTCKPLSRGLVISNLVLSALRVGGVLQGAKAAQIRAPQPSLAGYGNVGGAQARMGRLPHWETCSSPNGSSSALPQMPWPVHL